MECCCCIPIQAGTIFLAFISLIISIMGAVGFFIKPSDVAPGMARGLTIFFGVCFVIMALIYVFGIIGSAFQSPAGIRIFSVILWTFVVFYTIISIVTIISTANNRQSEVDRCTEEFKKHCDSSVTVMIWSKCILMFITILLGMYFAGVTSRFAQKLETNFRTRYKFGRKGMASSSSSIQSVSSNDYNPHSTTKKSTAATSS